jgi:hypothetical protein
MHKMLSEGAFVREMGQMWDRNYHQRHINLDSLHICKLICSLVRAEAALKIGNLRGKLAEILDEAGIPIAQFDECEAEP